MIDSFRSFQSAALTKAHVFVYSQLGYKRSGAKPSNSVVAMIVHGRSDGWIEGSLRRVAELN